jgi:hypothetical protein
MLQSIGFTDFACEVAEGSKFEIFRRCDAGASNENEKEFNISKKYGFTIFFR